MPRCTHSPALVPHATERLRQDERKITGPRRLILETLCHNAHPMTRKEIFSRMPQGSCNLATVYRALHLLEDAGLVKQYDFGDGIARYEFQTDEQASHHHHLICTRCASVAKVEACFPREWQEQIAQENGYEQVTHRLEFFGVCPACARKTD